MFSSRSARKSLNEVLFVVDDLHAAIACVVLVLMTPSESTASWNSSQSRERTTRWSKRPFSPHRDTRRKTKFQPQAMIRLRTAQWCHPTENHHFRSGNQLSQALEITAVRGHETEFRDDNLPGKMSPPQVPVHVVKQDPSIATNWRDCTLMGRCNLRRQSRHSFHTRRQTSRIVVATCLSIECVLSRLCNLGRCKNRHRNRRRRRSCVPLNRFRRTVSTIHRTRRCTNKIIVANSASVKLLSSVQLG